MQTCRRSSSNLSRLALAVLVAITGFASNTYAQTFYQVVVAFDGSNGKGPSGGVIQGHDGSFYGTTSQGGSAGFGTVFKVDAAGTLTTLHSFSDGEGANARAGLIQGNDGSFYGTTSQGGSAGFGTVFKIDAAGALTTLHSFNGPDGAGPQAGVIQASDGSFYGTTSQGGSAGFGTVFKIDAAGALTTLHSFNGPDGAGPQAGVIQASDGSFYGTTWGGLGAAGAGTIFKIDAAGTLTTFHTFDGVDIANPYAGLIQATDGSFYGPTFSGGSTGYGTIFKIDAGGTVTLLHSLNPFNPYSEGAWPKARLSQGNDGSFYGSTSCNQGGNTMFCDRTIFKMDAAGTVTILHRFHNNLDGASPSGLLQASDGSFYGTMGSGGANGAGLVFRLSDTASTGTTLTVSPTPTTLGQSVTLTATVTTDSGTPTGSVTFLDGLSSLGHATLNGGTAGLNTTTLAGGSHALRAEYAGANAFAASTSPVVTHTVVLLATFIYPVDHATNVDLTQPFTWTTVTAQAYYLYIGSTLGANDLVNTGEMQQTSYLVRTTLPTNQTLYARLWTKVGGTWRFVDASFSSPSIARFTYPAAITTAVNPTLPLTWTTIPAAQAYYLYIGSTTGAKDLVNTGEIQQTSYLLRSTVPVNQSLYARLWTKVGGVWRFTDRIFSVMSLMARFTNPVTGGTTIDRTKPLTWTTVASAQAYYLYVGSTLGARDLVNTGEIYQTSYLLGNTLPAGQTLYARLWTKVGEIWRYVDTTFTVR